MPLIARRHGPKQHARSTNQNCVNDLSLPFEYTIGSYSVSFDNDFKVKSVNGSLIVYCGFASSNGSIISPDQIVSDPTILRHAQGSFLYIIVSESRIWIIKSLIGPFTLYILKAGSNYVISTTIEHLLNTPCQPELSINLQYCIRNVIGEDDFGTDTIINEISEMRSGELVSTDLKSEWENQLLNEPFKSSSTISGSIKESLNHYLLTGKKPVILASGGVDSSALQYVLSGMKIDYSAVHIEYSNQSENSESEHAKKVADTLGIDLQIMKLERNVRFDFTPPSANSHEEVSQAANTSGHILKSSDVCVLTGHGGDHLFMQDPTMDVVVDSLVEKRPLEAIGECFKYSRLKRHNVYNLAWKSVKRYLNRNKIKFAFIPKWLKFPSIPIYSDHYLLDGLNTGSAKYRHVCGILSAARDCGDPEHPFKRGCSPLMLQGMIGHVLTTPVRDLYTAEYDRILERTELWNLSNDAVFWRRTKGDIVPNMMEEFSNSSPSHLKLLELGYLNQRGILDMQEIRRVIVYSATVAVLRDTPFVFRLLMIESKLRHLAEARLFRTGRTWSWYRPL